MKGYRTFDTKPLLEDSAKTEFQKAVEWHTNLDYDAAVAICKEANPNTPYSIKDDDLIRLWEKHLRC